MGLLTNPPALVVGVEAAGLEDDREVLAVLLGQFAVELAGGGARTITFRADAAGTYKYYDGMHRSGYGILEVLPQLFNVVPAQARRPVGAAC